MAVVPESELFPSGQTQQQVVQQDTLQMVNSQQSAAGRGPVHARHHFTTLDTITQTEKGMPAAGVLRRGDVVTAVNGVPVSCNRATSTLIRAHPAGTPVDLTITRSGRHPARAGEDDKRPGACRDRGAGAGGLQVPVHSQDQGGQHSAGPAPG